MLKANVKELKVVCKQLGIKGYSRLNKAELVERINSSVPSRTNIEEEETIMRYAPKQYVPVRSSKRMEEIFEKYGAETANEPVSAKQLKHLELLSNCFVEVPDDAKEFYEYATKGEAYRFILFITKNIEDGVITHYPVAPVDEAVQEVQVKLPSTRQLAELERLSKLTGIKVSEPDSMKIATELITKLRKKEWQLKQIAASKAVAKEAAVTTPSQEVEERLSKYDTLEKQSKFVKLLAWLCRK